uniref:Uncharacterized protein n=1 Tax=Anguilla anguilla TaxID=7936 RepID=A0A0E9TQA2_ANGAN
MKMLRFAVQGMHHQMWVVVSAHIHCDVMLYCYVML